MQSDIHENHIMETLEKISRILNSKFSPQHLEINDETRFHQGHPGLRETDGGHYHITIVSKKFTKKRPLERHRLVYEALQNELKENIHALSLKAYTPQEWQNIS